MWSLQEVFHFRRKWPSSLLDITHEPCLRHGVETSQGVCAVGSVVPGGRPLLLQEAACAFRAPAEMVRGCVTLKFLKYPCYPGRMLILFPLPFRWIGYLQRKFKSKYFHTHVSLFLRCRRRKGEINNLLLLVWSREPQCGGRSWFTRLLCKRMERGDATCQADEEGKSVCKGHGRWRICVWNSRNKHSVLLYGSRDQLTPNVT